MRNKIVFDKPIVHNGVVVGYEPEVLEPYYLNGICVGVVYR